MLLARAVDLESKDKYNQTLLMWATYSGHEAVMELLFEIGANWESKSNNGQKLLLWAAYYENEATVKKLLEKEKPNELESKGQIWLLYARYHGH